MFFFVFNSLIILIIFIRLLLKLIFLSAFNKSGQRTSSASVAFFSFKFSCCSFFQFIFICAKKQLCFILCKLPGWSFGLGVAVIAFDVAFVQLQFTLAAERIKIVSKTIRKSCKPICFINIVGILICYYGGQFPRTRSKQLFFDGSGEWSPFLLQLSVNNIKIIELIRRTNWEKRNFLFIMSHDFNDEPIGNDEKFICMYGRATEDGL